MNVKFINLFTIIFIPLILFFCSKTGDIKERDNPFDPDGINYSHPDLKIYLKDYFNNKDIFGATLTIDGKELFHNSTDKYYYYTKIDFNTYTVNISHEGYYSHAVDITIESLEDKVITNQLMPHYRLIKRWGSYGNGQGQFDNPQDICVEKGGTDYVYVADNYNDRVQKFDTQGNYITKFTHGSINGVYGICYLSGHIYVVARHNWNVFDFFSNGTFNQSWNYGTGYEDIIGSGNDLYMVSTINIRKIDINGTTISNSDNIFNFAYGITIDSTDNLIIAEDDRIHVFDSNLKFIKQWGSFQLLSSVAVDNQDNIYAVDAHTGIIYKYSSNGVLLSRWGNHIFDVELNYPMGIDLDSDGNVYIIERDNHRVSVYAPVSN